MYGRLTENLRLEHSLVYHGRQTCQQLHRLWSLRMSERGRPTGRGAPDKRPVIIYDYDDQKRSFPGQVGALLP
ncbi:hypothetical protein RRG08_022399 [Elysia crispata]|uniref:Uncharacterized protein n=1 Tax=Elysia crispata TaxID=231223 RepID=A0AAE0Z346_9GAST|nr:hypothetical protein RRG08_022399 [Elysia crispata]